MATARGNYALKETYAKKLSTETDPLELLRAHCLSRGAAGIKGIGRVFRIMDDDGSKTLCLEEFRKGLKDYGVFVDNQIADELFRRFDRDRSGTIDFNEFLLELRPPMSNNRKALITQAYNKLDKTKDGIVTVEDLKGVYNVERHPKFISGEWTQDRCFEEFLKTFEPPNEANGEVTMEEFMNYYCGVSASIDSDAYFDLMMRNSWKLGDSSNNRKKAW